MRASSHHLGGLFLSDAGSTAATFVFFVKDFDHSSLPSILPLCLLDLASSTQENPGSR